MLGRVSVPLCARSLLFLAVLLTAAGVLAPARAGAAGIDRPMKLELIDVLEAAPQTLWLGSSTSREVDPDVLTALSGRTAFNAAVSAGRPLEARVFASAMAGKFPAAVPHIVIGLDVEQFRRERQDPIRRRPAGSQPPPSRRYRADGFRKINPYAAWVLSEHLAPSIRRYVREVYPAFRGLDPVQVRELRALIEMANIAGGTPSIVIMPAHPSFIRTLRPLGRPARRAALLQTLAGFAADGLKFRQIDLGTIGTFGGTPAGFYDCVHMRPATMRMLLKRVDDAGLLEPPAVATP